MIRKYQERVCVMKCMPGRGSLRQSFNQVKLELGALSATWEVEFRVTNSLIVCAISSACTGSPLHCTRPFCKPPAYE